MQPTLDVVLHGHFAYWQVSINYDRQDIALDEVCLAEMLGRHAERQARMMMLHH